VELGLEGKTATSPARGPESGRDTRPQNREKEGVSGLAVDRDLRLSTPTKGRGMPGVVSHSCRSFVARECVARRRTRAFDEF